MGLEIIPLHIENEIKPGDNLIELMLASKPGATIQDRDILVFTQKIISKQEGRLVDLSGVNPTLLATGIASEYKKDPRVVQLILEQSKRIVRMRNGVIISETVHGLVCANAGIDESNVEKGYVTLLPQDANASAQKLRKQIKEKTGNDVAVIISDTFGRPFRQGQTNVAIGDSGIPEILDYAGTQDNFGRVLRVTAIAIVDEICSATELVMNKSIHVPIAIVRGYNVGSTKNTIKDLIRPHSEDLFR